MVVLKRMVKRYSGIVAFATYRRQYCFQETSVDTRYLHSVEGFSSREYLGSEFITSLRLFWFFI